MKTNSMKVISATVLGLLFQVAEAGSITDINVSVLPNKQRVIKLRFDGGAVEPTGFVTAAPSQIALDFSGTDVKLAQSNLTFQDELLTQVMAAQNSGNTRVLLGLAKESEYNAVVKGDEVWIYVNEAKTINTAPVASQQGTYTTPAAKSYQDQSEIVTSNRPFNIDFHKGPNASGVIEFVTNSMEKPVVQAQSDRVIITIKNYPLATQDQKNLDVTDFSTPVRNVVVRRLGNDTQITIRNQGTWQHKLTSNAGRTSIQILPNVKNTTLGVSQRKVQKKFTGRSISLDFQNIDVRTVLQIIAKEANINIVASDSVQGKMTLNLKDVPWDQALDLVMEARDLDMRRNGNIINIAPRQDLEKKDKDELKALQDAEELGPLFTKSYQLKYKNVEEFRKVLRIEDSTSTSNRDNSILSKRGSALIDPSTNTLIITDNQVIIKKFDSLLEELDVPARQVMVEARIVEAIEGFSRDLGVQFGVGRAKGRTAIGTNLNSAIDNYNNASKTILGANIALPINTSTGTIGLVRAIGSTALGLELSASETDNRSKTISTPRVLTQDRQEAEIRQGTQVPYVVREKDGYSTAFKDAVLSLKVIPRITPDNKIILDVVISKDEPNYTNVNAAGEPAIDTKYVKTQAMVEDGGTLIVGGIYQETIFNNLKKVPLLSDIPVLGNLFKSRSRAHSRNELLFFITPRIMGAETSVLRY